MKKTIHITQCFVNMTLVIWLSTFVACQEPFENDALSANKNINVISCQLTNIEKINSFELYYALPYTTTKKNTISNAQITIIGDNGTLHSILDNGSGTYRPTSTIPLTKGVNYKAEVLIENNDILSSSEQLMLDTLAYDAIFSEPTTYSTVEKNEFGEYVTIDREGVMLHVRIQQPNEDSYLRLKTDYYVHSYTTRSATKIITINTPVGSLNYEVTNDTVYDIYEGFSNSDFPIVEMLKGDITYSNNALTFQPLFLEADPNCYNFEQHTEYTFIEWIMPIDLYNTPENSFNYYQAAISQLTAPGQIFDPIPDQVEGNMFNESHPEETVLGFFDISAVNRRYYSIYLYESLGYRMYRGRDAAIDDIEAGWYVRSTRSDTVLINE